MRLSELNGFWFDTRLNLFGFVDFSKVTAGFTPKAGGKKSSPMRSDCLICRSVSSNQPQTGMLQYKEGNHLLLLL